MRRAALAGDTFDLLYHQYGEMMAFADICSVLAFSQRAGYSRLRRGTFPIRVFKNDVGHFRAMTGDVAQHIDTLRREGVMK